MQMRRIFADTVHSVIHLHGAEVDALPSNIVRENEEAYQPGQYVACTYDNQWYIGNIVERSDINSDLLINFMQRSRKRGCHGHVKQTVVGCLSSICYA